jgi:pyrimidine dimer DNA glycosylase
MQTFLPHGDFRESAVVLDQRRLGKQRVEAIQVLRALTVAGYGWRHHPAAAMWAGYEEALTRYGLTVCAVWCAAGRQDTCGDTLRQDLRRTIGLDHIRGQRELAATGDLPPWLGDATFHRSHQSALVRKDPAHYRPHFPDVPDDLPYVWPSSDRPRHAALDPEHGNRRAVNPKTQ